MNGVSFEVERADLTDDESEAIVCCTDESFSIDDGLSSAVVRRGGPSVARACAKLRAEGSLADNEAAITPAGNLPARYVIHVRRPRDIDHCMRVLGAALVRAKEKRFKSIAIPLLQRDISSQQTSASQWTSAAHSFDSEETTGSAIRYAEPQLSKSVLAACMTDALVLAAQRKALGRLRLVRLLTLSERDRLILTDALSNSLSGRSSIERALHVEAEQRDTERRRRTSSEKRGRVKEVERISSPSSAIESVFNKLATPVVGLFGNIVDAMGTAARTSGPSKSVRFPSVWEPMRDEEAWRQVQVTPDDGDYKEIAALFTLSGRKLEEIHRIQNPIRYAQYDAERERFKKLYASTSNTTIERRLFHGTNSSNVQNINSQGFDRGFSGQHATYFGRGAYFARRIEYAAQDTFAAKDPSTGLRYLYVARVLVGAMCRGEQNMTRLPEGFDCAVDQLDSPSIFVVFRDAQAYPEYLFVFR